MPLADLPTRTYVPRRAIIGFRCFPSSPLSPVPVFPYSQSLACGSTSRSMDASARSNRHGRPHRASDEVRNNNAMREADTRLRAPLGWNMSGLSWEKRSRPNEALRIRSPKAHQCGSSHVRAQRMCCCAVRAQLFMPCELSVHRPRVGDARASAVEPRFAPASPVQEREKGRGPRVSPHNIGSVRKQLCGDIEIRPMTKILSPSPDLASVCGSLSVKSPFCKSPGRARGRRGARVIAAAAAASR